MIQENYNKEPLERKQQRTVDVHIFSLSVAGDVPGTQMDSVNIENLRFSKSQCIQIKVPSQPDNKLSTKRQ